jgi:V8-like Glu-specific endopeptidase
MPKHPRVPACAAALLLSLAACSPDGVTDATPLPAPVDDAVLAMLSTSGEWEIAAHPVSLAQQAADDRVAPEESGLNPLTESALARLADLDETWQAADGERYEALYIHGDGRAYGRRSAARPAFGLPGESNGFGAFAGDASSSGDGAANVVGGLEAASRDRGEAVTAQARITTNWEDDRRYRVYSGMTTYPTRVIGSMSGSGGVQDGACTGTKVGPRAVLTAAHCVMNSDGNISLSGRFNPGQTNSTTPNGSLTWSGVFLRDWRVHRRYDYAIVYLADSPSTVGLGWMGIGWWNSASSYNGRGSSLFGYPCGANRDCGEIDEQRCKASPRTDHRCDGWMYGHARPLTTSSFRSDDLLQYDNDMSSGQSGSAVYTWFNNSPMVLAVNTHSWSGVSMGPRFRQSMWNDVCAWIAHPAKQSAYATHPLCN